jgi:parallel beta-helix repeat protein
MKRLALTGCLVLLAASPARATIVIVPDHAPDVQTAVNLGRDTVLVRSGTYDDEVGISYPVVLIGEGVERPRVGTLYFVTQPYGYNVGRFEVRNFDVQRELTIVNSEEWSEFYLRHCTIGGGIGDLSGFSDRTLGIWITNCEITGDALVQARGWSIVDSCRISGSLSLNAENLYVRHNTLIGSGSGTGIWASAPTTEHCTIEGNTVSNYAVGIRAGAGTSARVTGNTVEDCSGWGVYAGYRDVWAEDNRIRRCGIGLKLDTDFEVHIARNHVGECVEDGVKAEATGSVEIVDNVLWACGSDGVEIVGTIWRPSRIATNTCHGHGQSGLRVGLDLLFHETTLDVVGNIGSGNDEYGMVWTADLPTRSECNDWFGNTLGRVDGALSVDQDLEVDPLFCDAPGADFHLQAGSPLASAPGCDRIGALGVACATTSTAVTSAAGSGFAITRVTPNPSRGPTRIRFQVPVGARVTIDVHDVLGRRVETLVNGWYPSGTHEVQAGSSTDRQVGVFWARLRHPGGEHTVRFARVAEH